MRKFFLMLYCFFGIASHTVAITQMSPPYALPYAAYGNTYDRYFTYYDTAGSIQYIYVKEGYDYHDFDLYYYWAGQTIVAKNVGGSTFSYNTLLVQCDTGNANCFEWSTYGSVMGVPSSCATPPILSTFDLHWGETGMNQYADPLYCGLGVLVANQKFLSTNIVPSGPAPSYLSFPLGGYNTTAYNAPVSSVMDNDVLGTTTPYTKNGTVTAYNGESFTAATGCNCYSTGLACNSSNYSSCTVPGYRKPGGGSWSFAGTGATQINYTDGGSYVYYDGHPGYDYAVGQNTDILAPAAGILCVASDSTTVQSPAEVWRYTTKCPLDSVVSTRWTIPNSNGHNTFYILHGELTINGSTNEYMTVFLHNADLSIAVRTTVEQDGYADVTRLQHVAEVGNVAPTTTGYHMHLEVYKKVSGSWTRVDPYGNGVSNILWQH